MEVIAERADKSGWPSGWVVIPRVQKPSDRRDGLQGVIFGLGRFQANRKAPQVIWVAAGPTGWAWRQILVGA